MACYAAQRWLSEAIESVLAQSFRQFEFILIDDGSRDRTAEIIEKYRIMDKRIVVISKSNTGLTHSLNVGLARAQGEWIARLDSDDLSEPTRLEEQMAFVERHPDVVLLGTGSIDIDSSGQVIKGQDYPSSHSRLLRHLERLQRFFPHSSAVFRRDVVSRIGGYNAVFREAQDWDLWLRFAENGQIACLKRRLVRVRRHTDQISNSDRRRQLIYGIAGVVCHFLRIRGEHAYLATLNEARWLAFVSWIEKRLEEEGVFDRVRIWTDARARYYESGSKLNRAISLCYEVITSGHAALVVKDKLFGSSIPRRLAYEALTRQCVES